MLNPVDWNNTELHMLAGYLNLRAEQKPKEISGSLYLFREKPKNLMKYYKNDVEISIIYR